VSEHDAVEEEIHRPARRRRNPEAEAVAAAAAAQAALELVETHGESVAAAPMEDALPRRTKPRRRRGGEVASEPLQLVETQPGAEPKADGATNP
jgi:hypothetical protein